MIKTRMRIRTKMKKCVSMNIADKYIAAGVSRSIFDKIDDFCRINSTYSTTNILINTCYIDSKIPVILAEELFKKHSKKQKQRQNLT